MTMQPDVTPGLPRRSVLAGAAAALLCPHPALAAKPATPRFPVRIRDMQVTDARTGGRFMLMRDLLRDRVAVLNFMFTGCSTTCPMQAAILSRAQQRLGRAMGRDALFLSISISPLTDTNDALVGFAERHAAGAGWHFLRGAIADTQRFQDGFDAFAPRVEDHPPVFAIGRAGDSRWSRLYGAPTPRMVADEVRTWLGAA